MDVAAPALAFIASLALLIWGAGVFIHSAESAGLRLGLSPFIIGVTVVAFGTSLPELVASIASVLSGSSEIAVGTVVGSNVTNILLVLAVATWLGGGIRIDYELVRVDLPFLFGSALLFWIGASDGQVGFLEGLISVAALSVYIVYAASSPEHPSTTVGKIATDSVSETRLLETTVSPWLRLVGGIVLTQLGAYWTVGSLVSFSAAISIPSDVVATTLLAIGTSLPELVVSARSAVAGKPEIAVGNVVGSNIFNALGVVGVAALFGPLTIPATLAAFGIPAMVGVTVLAFFVLQEREMTRWDAGLLLATYLAFTLQIVRSGILA